MTTPASIPTPARRRRLAALAATALGAATVLAFLPPHSSAQPAGGPNHVPAVAPVLPPSPSPSNDVSDDEWRAVHDFMAQNSPQKWKAMGRQQRERLKPSIVARYRNLQMVRVDDARYKAELAALKLEDEIYGLLVQLKDGQPVEPALRAKVGELVDNRMAWRRERLFRSLKELNALEAHDAAKALQTEIAKEEKGRASRREKRIEDRMLDLLKPNDKKNVKPKILPGGRGGPPVTSPSEAASDAVAPGKN